MQTNRLFLSTALVISFPTLALSSDPKAVQNSEPGYYVGAGIGASIPNDSDYKSTALTGEIDLETSPLVSATAGYRYGNGLRSEIELSYSQHDVNSIANTQASGDLTSSAAAANIIYDINTNTPITPYLGGGLGVALINADTKTSASSVDDSDIAPVAQGILGLSYRTEQPFDIYTQYSYKENLGDLNFRDNTGAKVESDYKNQALTIGLRYRFGTTTKLAQAAPASPIATDKSRTYMVFFDFNKSEITAEAETILKNAVTAMREGRVIKLEISGHADRSGTDQYNQALSQKRAEAIKAAIANLGIQTESVKIIAKGESEPLVPTEDGVKEPQNRRVEIIYSTRK
jgi:outer membrane protein OmpA-like peptidoglycan-associated protein